VAPGWRKHFAAVLGISRAHYYIHPARQKSRDEAAIKLLLNAHTEHPFYGVKRLALYLGWSENKTRRLRNKASIVIERAMKRRRIRVLKAQIPMPINAIKQYAVFKNEARPWEGMNYEPMTHQAIWVQDFTYLWFERSWHYLAAVVQLKTRQIVGWKLGLRHSSELTHAALLDALSKYSSPAILHSDAGSEYLSYKHEQLCLQMNIVLSCSNKGSPWENGFMERVFGTIKLELGPLSEYSDLGALHEAIALSIHYYNTKRIHSALKMSPNDYATSLSKVETLCL
jgi:transposase InsO family protein